MAEKVDPGRVTRNTVPRIAVTEMIVIRGTVEGIAVGRTSMTDMGRRGIMQEVVVVGEIVARRGIAIGPRIGGDEGLDL